MSRKARRPKSLFEPVELGKTHLNSPKGFKFESATSFFHVLVPMQFLWGAQTWIKLDEATKLQKKTRITRTHKTYPFY